LAVVGPSGCGKTTLLLAAGGLLRPDAGEVRIDGADPYALDADARAELRAREVGFVFQQFHLVAYLSVIDNVLAPCLARPLDGARQRARELIERFGLAGRADHLPGELSTGERQRTALARAMLHSPRLICADEPTGNLDEDNGRVILESLRDFATAGGAVLMVTHDLRVAELADRTVGLREGRVAEFETAEAGR
jgi:ABC-type lipoprotein export system ATPase subunit